MFAVHPVPPVPLPPYPASTGPPLSPSRPLATLSLPRFHPDCLSSSPTPPPPPSIRVRPAVLSLPRFTGSGAIAALGFSPSAPATVCEDTREYFRYAPQQGAPLSVFIWRTRAS